MENPIKMDDLGVPLFLETPIHNSYMYIYIFMGEWKGKWMSRYSVRRSCLFHYQFAE